MSDLPYSDAGHAWSHAVSASCGWSAWEGGRCVSHCVALDETVAQEGLGRHDYHRLAEVAPDLSGEGEGEGPGEGEGEGSGEGEGEGSGEGEGEGSRQVRVRARADGEGVRVRVKG
jgi:hypothetical protein